MSDTPPATETASRTIVHTVRVEFGDCDPARIVWFPNYFRWIDAASQHFFVSCGVPPWHELEKTTGVLGTPLVDTHSRFLKTASYGDVLQIETRITAWRRSSFTQSYRVLRAQPNGEGAPDVILECDEVRIFATHREDGERGIRAVPIPEDIRALCS
jgi:4-hydroxybenzoyl-CoA thioesterase